MVVTVTLNPCIDQTLSVAAFTHGGMNRVTQARRDIAGKGVNVSVALTHLGLDSICTGFNYEENGQWMEAYLDGQGVAHDFIGVSGAIRTNVKLFEQDTRTMTEINQPGGYVPPEAVEALLEKIAALRADVLVLSGSRPQGVEPDIYQRIIARSGGRVILDTEGEALLKGLSDTRHQPYLIKPNLFELESSFGVTLPDKRSVVDFGRTWIEKGLAVICVSMGAEGALIMDATHAYYAPALDVPVRGVQGAGDAMVAGMVLGLTRGAAACDLLRFATAAAAASVIRDGTQMCTREGFEEMLTKVRIEELF